MIIDMSRIRNNLFRFLEFIFGAFGFIISLIGFVNKNTLSERILFLLILLYSLLLIIHGVYLCALYLLGKFRNADQKAKICEKDLEIKNLKSVIDQKDKTFKAVNENCMFITGNLTFSLDELMIAIDKYAQNGEDIEQEAADMKTHGYTEAEIESKANVSNLARNIECCTRIIKDYNRFLANITNKAKDSIENYLRSKGFEYPVAISIKQIIDPPYEKNIHEIMKEEVVYTSFRDFNSYSNPSRNEREKFLSKESGEYNKINLYKIADNTDFQYCISKDCYIFNNKAKSSRDYCNSSSGWHEKYNCGATTIIQSQDSSRIVYGFLACDIYNTNFNSKDIIDDNVALVLRTISKIISVYYDNIHYNWCFYAISSFKFNSFWEMLYTYHANSKEIF